MQIGVQSAALQCIGPSSCCPRLRPQVLLVKAWSGKSWGFPKGKIDRDEDKLTCAIREVAEEVGYDISELVDPDQFVEMQARHPTGCRAHNRFPSALVPAGAGGDIPAAAAVHRVRRA